MLDANSDGDGGWNTSNFTVDPKKIYVYGVYMWQVDTTGSGYLGLSGSHTENLSDTANTNPYFWYGDLPQSQKWYLVLGVCHPEGYTGGDIGLDDVYDVATGQKVADATEFRQKAGSTSQIHRCYHYYNTTGDLATVKQRLARPFVMEASRMSGVEYLTKKSESIEAGTMVGAQWRANDGSGTNISGFPNHLIENPTDGVNATSRAPGYCDAAAK